ncbi:MAG TPA: hypothetical protein VGY53_07790, partial [Isosphaeraceae bacterium]|nr:hypothetical protein [Isosphaeraceae bacterium]
FERSLAIRLELAKDTHNARSQRDVSIAFERLGDVRQKLGDLAGAHSAYQKSLAIRLELAKDTQNAEAQRDLYETRTSIGQILMLLDDAGGACEAFAKALDVAREISRAGKNPDSQKALAESYGNLAFAELFQRRFQEAIAASREGLKADPTQTFIATNLAHGLLFTNQLEEAKNVYSEYKDVKLGAGQTFAQAVLDDFRLFRQKGLTHPDMEKIEKMLNEPNP